MIPFGILYNITLKNPSSFPFLFCVTGFNPFITLSIC